jgi:23S rRNA U2552 (ribose-2'-O)-methylase RlmE/FtsJ
LLNKLGKKYGTDKVFAGNISKKSKYSYLDIYERYFYKKINDTLKIFEIGIAKGASLRMWEKYFKFSKIYGIDIKDCKQYDTNKIKTFQCNQKDVKELSRIGIEFGKFDIIIDDGCHLNEYIIDSFNTLWYFLKKGGFYCIEDLHCSYIDHPADEIDEQRYDRERMNKFFNTLMFCCDNIERDIFSINFYPSLCIIRKNNT